MTPPAAQPWKPLARETTLPPRLKQDLAEDSLTQYRDAGDLEGLKKLITELAEIGVDGWWETRIPLLLLDGAAKHRPFASGLIDWLAAELEITNLPLLVLFARSLCGVFLNADLREEMAARRGTAYKTTWKRFDTNAKALEKSIERLSASSRCDYLLHRAVMSSGPMDEKVHSAAVEGMARFAFERDYFRGGIRAAVHLKKFDEAIAYHAAAPATLIWLSADGTTDDPSLLANLAWVYAATGHATEGLKALERPLAELRWSSQTERGLVLGVTSLLAAAKDHPRALAGIARAVDLGVPWAEIEDRAGTPELKVTPEYAALEKQAEAAAVNRLSQATVRNVELAGLGLAPETLNALLGVKLPLGRKLKTVGDAFDSRSRVVEEGAGDALTELRRTITERGIDWNALLQG